MSTYITVTCRFPQQKKWLNLPGSSASGDRRRSEAAGGRGHGPGVWNLLPGPSKQVRARQQQDKQSTSPCTPWMYLVLQPEKAGGRAASGTRQQPRLGHGKPPKTTPHLLALLVTAPEQLAAGHLRNCSIRTATVQILTDGIPQGVRVAVFCSGLVFGSCRWTVCLCVAKDLTQRLSRARQALCH